MTLCISLGEVRVQRFATNPLITPASSPTLGENINGPSVIRVPSWLPNPLGRYYLYFAHHAGTFIRLAYADDVQGPWRIYEPGTLHLEDAPAFYDHIASPDVHVGLDHCVGRWAHSSMGARDRGRIRRSAAPGANRDSDRPEGGPPTDVHAPCAWTQKPWPRYRLHLGRWSER